jgi:hypothetical protein
MLTTARVARLTIGTNPNFIPNSDCGTVCSAKTMDEKLKILTQKFGSSFYHINKHVWY